MKEEGALSARDQSARLERALTDNATPIRRGLCGNMRRYGPIFDAAR
jgi:hypothetical protein